MKFKDKIYYEQFITIDDYLEKYEKIIKLLAVFNHNAIVMLAAAVSDYFIPNHVISKDKIQSSSDNLLIELYPVKKEIFRIKEEWNKNCYLVTFKVYKQ